MDLQAAGFGARAGQPRPGSHKGNPLMLHGKPVKKIAILADPKDPQKIPAIRAALDRLLPALERSGIQAVSFITLPVEQIQLDDGIQMFLVLGGDGSMIHFAAHFSQCGIPFYGINYGNVGFMMNTPGQEPERHINHIAAGNFIMQEFPVLQVRATDLEGRIHEGVGLNDIYLQRMTPQSCRVDIRLNGTPLSINPLLCDGVIVATPLGSTAYNYNVTGSMVAINAPVIALTPVAAQRTCPISSLLLPTDSTVQFDILEPEKRRVQVVSDGQSHGNLTHAIIWVSPQRVRLCFPADYSKNLPMRFINKACGSGRR